MLVLLIHFRFPVALPGVLVCYLCTPVIADPDLTEINNFQFWGVTRVSK